jgi:amidase
MPAPGCPPNLPSALETARRIASGESTSVAEVEAAIARIEAANPAINAVVVKDYENARKAAVEADAAVKRGEKKPFLGGLRIFFDSS